MHFVFRYFMQHNLISYFWVLRQQVWRYESNKHPWNFSQLLRDYTAQCPWPNQHPRSLMCIPVFNQISYNVKLMAGKRDRMDEETDYTSLKCCIAAFWYSVEVRKFFNIISHQFYTSLSPIQRFVNFKYTFRSNRSSIGYIS